jgi:hypothetical protein
MLLTDKRCKFATCPTANYRRGQDPNRVSEDEDPVTVTLSAEERAHLA